MKKKWPLYLLLATIATTTPLIAGDYLTLQTQSKLRTGLLVLDSELRLANQFNKEPLENGLGTSGGANVGFNLRYHWRPEWEFELAYIGVTREYEIGANYDIELAQNFQSRFFGRYFTYSSPKKDKRAYNIFIGTSLQNSTFFPEYNPVLNIGYDGDTEELGLGIGAQYPLTSRLSIQAELYTNTDASEPGTTLALNWKGPQHQVIGFLSNSPTGFGTRHMMIGAPGNEYFLGVKINVLSFWELPL